MKNCEVCGHSLGVTNAKKYCSERCKRYKRPFRVWDGEGKTIGDAHFFTLLANSDGEYIENEDGLSTAACLAFLTAPRKKAYNVWFSFGYDVNKMLENIPLEGVYGSREQLWNEGGTRWRNYHIEYTPRKMFTVTHPARQSFHAYDAFGFFQKSFLKACEDWKIDTSEIVKGKESRADFGTWSADDIRDYNFKEMALLLELMNQLREALYDADVLPQQWHGPGAIASVWLKRERIDEHYGTQPDNMVRPIMHAYFGGRIDICGIGEYDAYEYDIASAYPSALCDCISTRSVHWETCNGYDINDRHALYHVSWRIPRSNLWGPFPWRTHNGVVLFPFEGEGYYWGVELLAAERLYGQYITRHDAFVPMGVKTFPFKSAIIRDYQKRAELKAAGHAANVAIKLALNSLYGKTCQHEAKHGKPRWQNYVWGGYITAYARARILDAMRILGPSNVLAIATDGLYTRVPLTGAYTVDTNNPLDYVPLGEWENKGLAKMLIVAPGLYARLTGEKTKVYRSRGLPSRINYGFVLRSWGCTTSLNTDGADAIGSTKATFIGMGRALHTSLPCGIFVEEKRELQNVSIVGTSKRFPNPLDLMHLDAWNSITLLPKPRTEKVISYPYAWRPEYDPKDEKE